MSWQNITGLPRNKKGEGADKKKVPHYNRRAYLREMADPLRRAKRQARCRAWSKNNREKRKAYTAAYRKRNPDLIRRKARENRRKHYQQVDAFMAQHKSGGCQTCGEKDYRCLDFHHVDPSKKIRCVSKMLRTRRNWAAAADEIKKCIVICANCHRKLHAKGMV